MIIESSDVHEMEGMALRNSLNIITFFGECIATTDVTFAAVLALSGLTWNICLATLCAP
jgi:hypothetical protein